MTVELLVGSDKVRRVETTEFDRVVDFADITGRIEPDDYYCECPWEDWDHETRKLGYNDHAGLKDSRGYARTGWNDPNILIEVDDADIIGKWGYVRRDGESKQVWLERVARVKRNVLDQLVEWYSNGCEVYSVTAEYADYYSGLGGIIGDYDCAEEFALECRLDIADRMEDDGFIVNGKPEPPKPYSRIDAFREKIRRQLDMS